MDMADRPPRSRASSDRALDRPLIALQAAITSDAVIKAVIALLRRAVTCDFVSAFFRIEPHADGAVPYRMIDSRGRDFSAQLRDGSLFRDHPAASKLMANPGIKFITTREMLPPDEILHRSGFYRDAMQVIGFRHSIAIYFWEDPPQMPEAVFSPSRGEGQPDFTDKDSTVLNRLYPHIDAALRRVRAIEQGRTLRGELRALIDPARPMCVLHWDLSVAAANRAARELCAQWNGGDAVPRVKTPPFSLPAPLHDACIELKKRWGISLQHRPEAGMADRLSVRNPKRPELSAVVSLHVRHATTPLGKPAFLIEFDMPMGIAPANSAKRTPRRRGFTLQERELIRLVREGKSNQEIALEMGKALGSVKNAFSALFGKVGVHSRGALIARIGLPPVKGR